MEISTDNLLLGQEAFSNSIEAIVSADDFVSCLQSTIESPGKLVKPGEIPGDKSICGTVNGYRFKIRKSGAFANPCAKDIVGIVEGSGSSSMIKYRLETRPVVSFVQTSILVAVICIGLFSTLLFFTSMNLLAISSLGYTGLIAVGGPVVALIAFLLIFKVIESTGESDQEELIDHVKKLAAGINVSS